MKIFDKISRPIILALSIALGSSAVLAKPIKIELSTKGNDITFSQDTIQVKMTKPIEIEFTNKAEVGSEILHNVAIAKGDIKKYIAHMQEVQYDLEKLKKYEQTIAISEGIAPGKSVTVSFKVDSPGVYHYICTMPGHGDILDMKGKMLVVK